MSKTDDAGREPSWVPARAVLRTRRREVDWNTTIIAAGSFLLHFGAFSSLYSDWTDPIVDDGLTIARLVEAARDLPTLPEVETPEEPAPTRPTERPGATTTLPAKSGERGSQARGSAPRAHADPTAGLSDQMARLDAEMLATLSSTGPATDRVLRDSVLPLRDIDAVANRAVSLRSGLAFEPGSTLRPGETSQRLSDLGNTGGNDRPQGAGSARPVEGPRPTGGVVIRDPAPGDVPGAGGVIGGLQGAFRRCYQNGLSRENPDMAGSVRVTARIGSNGEVSSVSTAVGGTITQTVASCIAGRVSGAQFSPPTNGQGAVLVIPVALKIQ